MDTLTTTGVSDSALVSECVNGNQQAWIQLLDRYKRLIYAVTVRFSFDIEDRHDIFQAVSLETLKSLPSLRNASSLRYWILTITVRQCCLLRKSRREERWLQRDEAALTLQDPRADTMQIHLDAERAEMLREAMEELPETSHGSGPGTCRFGTFFNRWRKRVSAKAVFAISPGERICVSIFLTLWEQRRGTA